MVFKHSQQLRDTLYTLYSNNKSVKRKLTLYYEVYYEDLRPSCNLMFMPLRRRPCTATRRNLCSPPLRLEAQSVSVFGIRFSEEREPRFWQSQTSAGFLGFRAVEGLGLRGFLPPGILIPF